MPSESSLSCFFSFHRQKFEMDHPSLTNLLSRVAHLRKPPVRQDSRFLHLFPLEIIDTIADQLPLSSKILLSQTCRALWYHMHKSCFATLWHSITAQQRSETLNGLGNLLPDHYHCISCNALHRIDYEDFPANENRGIVKSVRPCERAEFWQNTSGFPFDSLSFRHVQATTKYTHMNTRHCHYRAKLLQKYESSCSEYYSQMLKIISEPRVISNRYILMRACIFSAGSEPYSFESISKILVRFCPHLGFGPVSFAARYPFGAAVQQAFQTINQQPNAPPKLFSCDRCPTDISIFVKEDEAYIVAWSDLGTGNSLQDPCWQSHLWTHWNNIGKGSRFEYDHGSVRAMYSSCPT